MSGKHRFDAFGGCERVDGAASIVEDLRLEAKMAEYGGTELILNSAADIIESQAKTIEKLEKVLFDLYENSAHGTCN